MQPPDQLSSNQRNGHYWGPGCLSWRNTPQMPEVHLCLVNQWIKLKDHILWKPSDLSAEEQLIAMMNKQMQSLQNKKMHENNNKEDNNEKMSLPFAIHQGKPGYSKEWDGKTWCYCPFNHKTSHWVLQKPKDCKMAKAKNKKAPAMREKWCPECSNWTPVDPKRIIPSVPYTLQFTASRILLHFCDPKWLHNRNQRHKCQLADKNRTTFSRMMHSIFWTHTSFAHIQGTKSVIDIKENPNLVCWCVYSPEQRSSIDPIHHTRHRSCCIF